MSEWARSCSGEFNTPIVGKRLKRVHFFYIVLLDFDLIVPLILPQQLIQRKTTTTLPR